MATNHGVRGSNPFLPDKNLELTLNPLGLNSLTLKHFCTNIKFEERWQSWSIASDLKSDEVQASVGSNPTFSDIFILMHSIIFC